ncbi:MAG TPA: protein kinase [Micromonosporaceae bacterium]|nr:protein kinase [Micromonosporaceae bacterium]
MATNGEPASRVGDVVGNRYRLVDLIGNGGMSVVWHAHDEVLDRPVAVKMLSQSGSDHFRVQLRAEARAYGRLNSPRIAQVYDYGETADATPYLVMEYVTGLPLAERLGSCAAMPWPEAVLMAAQVADALRDAHAHGLVHRDVKPDNVLLTTSGAKLVDFGICAMIGAPDAEADGTLLGTPAYLAPERIIDAPVNAAADVYGLGVLLYRALTGDLPWPADTSTGQLKAHMFAEPPQLPEIEGLPADVARVCAACLAKEPQARPSSASVAHTLWLATITANASFAMPISPAPAGATADAQESPAGALPASGARSSDSAAPVPSFAGGRASTKTSAFAVPAGLLGASARNARASVSSATRPLSRPFADAPTRRRRFLFPASAAALSLAVLGISWGVLGSGSGRHKAAPPASAAQSSCLAAFAIESDAGTTFAGRVTVTNASDIALHGWSVSFAFPGDQALIDATGADMPQQVTVVPTVGAPYLATIEQNGATVVARAPAESLAASESVALPIFARYSGTNAAPAVVALNGATCQTQDLNTAPPVPIPAATGDNNGRGDGNGDDGNGDGDHHGGGHGHHGGG